VASDFLVFTGVAATPSVAALFYPLVCSFGMNFEGSCFAGVTGVTGTTAGVGVGTTAGVGVGTTAGVGVGVGVGTGTTFGVGVGRTAGIILTS